MWEKIAWLTYSIIWKCKSLLRRKHSQSLQIPERVTFSSYLEFILKYKKIRQHSIQYEDQVTDALQASCLEVSGVASGWRECDFNTVVTRSKKHIQAVVLTAPLPSPAWISFLLVKISFRKCTCYPTTLEATRLLCFCTLRD